MKFATAVLILGMLAGCAVSPSDNTLDYRPGDGVVQAVEAARVALPNPGLLRPRWTEGYQLTLRMDDGTTQRVTQDSAAFKAGERVRITSDGRVLKAAPADDVSVARYRPGIGVVQVVQPGRVVLPAQGSGVIPGSEAAGGSYGSPVERVFRPRSSEGYQVTLNMEDGTTQLVTQPSAEFKVGDRVEVTAEGRLAKAAESPASAAAAGKPAAKAYRAGIGIVESAAVVSLPSASSAGGAAAGATGATMAYRVKMADGTTQEVVQAGEKFAVGDRVAVSGEGRLARP